MTKQFDAIVFNGRFQPLHNGHVEVIRRAGELAEKVIIIVGSSHQPRTFKNPFTFEERKNLLYKTCVDFVGSLIVEPNYDILNDDCEWASNVEYIVNGVTEKTDKIAIIGHRKDDSSFYLDMFPEWELIEVPLIDRLSATPIRHLYFNPDNNPKYFSLVVPEPTIEFLSEFSTTEDYQTLVRELMFTEKYKSQYASLPYPPTFVTVDAVVYEDQSYRVLMIRRKDEPGKGLWALPGGFLDANGDRCLEDAVLRELKEETNLNISNDDIYSSWVFDSIERSSRGRTITHAFFCVLSEENLPEVSPGDDAAIAQWFPISEINPSDCFEDHYEIINHFLEIRDITNYFEDL